MGGVHPGPQRRGEKGKLIAAVRIWAGGPDRPRPRRLTPDAAELAALTGDEDARPARPEPDPPEPDPAGEIRLWRPLWPVFELFALLGRSWRYPAFGGPPIGLDWTQARAMAEGLGVAWDRDTLTLLQAAEGVAADLWAARWERDHPAQPG